MLFSSNLLLLAAHYLNLFSKSRITKLNKTKKIFNDGYLGSHNDEERSEMRYAMRIAELNESSDFRTQPALKRNFGESFSMFVSVSRISQISI